MSTLPPPWMNWLRMFDANDAGSKTVEGFPSVAWECLRERRGRCGLGSRASWCCRPRRHRGGGSSKLRHYSTDDRSPIPLVVVVRRRRVLRDDLLRRLQPLVVVAATQSSSDVHDRFLIRAVRLAAVHAPVERVVLQLHVLPRPTLDGGDTDEEAGIHTVLPPGSEERHALACHRRATLLQVGVDLGGEVSQCRLPRPSSRRRCRRRRRARRHRAGTPTSRTRHACAPR